MEGRGSQFPMLSLQTPRNGWHDVLALGPKIDSCELRSEKVLCGQRVFDHSPKSVKHRSILVSWRWPLGSLYLYKQVFRTEGSVQSWQIFQLGMTATY